MTIVSRSLVLIAAAASCSHSIAATLVAEFNFNSPPPSLFAAWIDNAATPSTVSGGAAPLGSPYPFRTGSSADLNPVFTINANPSLSGLNNFMMQRSSPAPTAVSGSSAITINTNFTGYAAPKIEWDFLGGFRTSRFYQITASADGVNFSPVPTGVGSAVMVPGVGSATVSPSGLIEINFVNGLIPATAPTTAPDYLTSLSFAFPLGTVYDDNPNFKARIAAVHAPSTAAYLSSYAGTDSTDTVMGYTNSTVAGGGTVRYDLIRVYGTQIPEPSAIALAFCGSALVWRRRGFQA